MTDLVKYTPIPVSKLMPQIQQYKNNPSAIQRVILDNLLSYTNGQADTVDPTNPFVFLLESSCVNTAAAIQESKLNLNKQYSALAQTFDDLYMHMSDKDYLNIYATPATTNFTWMLSFTELLGNMVTDPATGNKKVTIARNTMVTVNNLTFSIQYPIDIIQYPNGSVQVMYDTTLLSPLQALSTNVIPYTITQDSTQVKWLSFVVPMQQFSLSSASFPIQASVILQEAIPFTGQYYYARVYYQNSATGNSWAEMAITHTQEVYDPLTPTVALSVDNTNNVLNVFLPPIYVDSGLVSGTLRVDVYTTNGQITVNLSNYVVTAFSANLTAIDTVNDLNEFTAAMALVSYTVFSAETVQGGNNGVSFDALKEMVVNNTVGVRNIPITNVQLVDQGTILGFTIVKNVDHITNRIFQATASLPLPTNQTLITPAALTIDTLVTTLAQLQASKEVINNVTQSTILSNTVFVENNGIISIYPDADLAALTAMATTDKAVLINNTNFLYNPFYYVLDYSAVEFSMRAYDLDAPKASVINFIYQNQTLQLSVNTGSISIAKTPSGYQITIVTSSGPMYQALDDSLVQVQLAYIPVGETNYAYINGVLIGKTGSERVFQFNLNTNYYIDVNDNIVFNNVKMFNTAQFNILTSLLQTCSIFYTTTSISTGYVPSPADKLIGKFLLPKNAALVTQESVVLQFGTALNNLWTRSLVNQSGGIYQTYASDVPATYPETVYATDPSTNTIFSIDSAGAIQYTVLHNAGDPMLDSNGNPIYLHRAGDPVLDSSGNPILDTALAVQYSCDLLLIDGKYIFATDVNYIDYRSEIRSILTTWINETLASITNMLLEQTNIYFYPKKSLSKISVMLDNKTTAVIDSAQTFVVKLYVSKAVYNDDATRAALTVLTKETINAELANNIVSISSMTESLKKAFDTSVISFSVTGLGGPNNNYDTVTLVNSNESLSLGKILEVQADGTTIVSENVNVTFVQYTDN